MMATMKDDGQNGRSLPEGWELSTLGESCDVVLGQSPSSDTYNAEGIGLPFYQGKTEFGNLYPTPVKWCSSPKKLAEKDDILISVRAPVGPTNLCPEKSCIGRGLAALRPKNMPTKYFLYYLRYIEKEWDSKATGTTFKAITGDVLRNQEIPLAPLPEQERIVSRIEELLSDLDAGVAALERVRAGLRRYKASVLKAAVSGKLVQQNPVDEPAKELLRQLGKTPLEGDSSSPLPEGWCWVTWDQVGKSQNGRGFPSKEYQAEGVKLLRPGNLFASGDVIWTEENTRYLPEKWEREFPQFVVGENELIINLTAQSLKDEFLGRVCLTSPDEHCLLNQRLARLSPLVGEQQFFLFLFKSKIFRKFVDGLNKGSLIQHMFTSQLVEFTFPLPPLDEQQRIVADVERRLSVVGEVESAVEAGRVRAGRLRQAVLRAAFEGRLG